MKLRILNYGFKAEHEQITRLDSLFSALSFNDFDAFVFDPAAVVDELRFEGKQATDRVTVTGDESGSLRSTLNRHSREILELIWYKGRAVICILRDNTFRWQVEYWTQGAKKAFEAFGPYFLIEKVLNHGNKNQVLRSLVHGVGEQIQLERGALPSYLRTGGPHLTEPPQSGAPSSARFYRD